MRPATRWTLYGGLGALAGALAYVLSLPWYPHKTLRELLGPVPTTTDGLQEYMMRALTRPPLTTLGTTYGNVAYALLGGLVASFLVGTLRTERSGLLRGVFWAVLAFPAGAVAGRGLDAFSDVLTIAMGNLAGPLPHVLWSLLVAVGIALTIGILQGAGAAIMRRALVAGLLGAVACYAMRSIVAPIGELVSEPDDLMASLTDPMAALKAQENRNLWESARVDFAAEYASLGLAIGLGFAFAESRLRRATVRWEVGRNEGREWELAKGPVLIGSAEAATIRLPATAGVAPRHAAIVGHDEAYALHPEAGATPTLNGTVLPAGQAAWLSHGDRIGLGRATLVFAEAHRSRAKATPASPAPAWQRPTSGHRLEHIDGRRVELPEGTTTLGRDPGCGVVLALPAVSRRHAEIAVAGGAASVNDLASAAGTRVNGATIIAPRPLADGDTLDLGPARLIYRKG